MPLYQYGCSICGAQTEATRTVANRRRAPKHCGKRMQIQITADYHISPLFTPYRAVAGDRRYIRNKDEHRGFLKEFGYEEVGNDRSMLPQETDEEFSARAVKERAEIANIERETKSIIEDLAKFNGEH